jgi:23S rRNA (pseudouridine1915-N3)-methyltransferase
VKIAILAVGRLKEKHWAAAEADYLERLGHYAQVTVREVADEAALIAALPARHKLIALDERGDLVTSEEVARKILGAHENHGGGATLCFAIGGADGHSAAVRDRAERLIAFGRITLPHRLVRVVLCEQLYRGYSILRGEPYHRGG